MIVCLRGLNGSDKSHLVREVMRWYEGTIETRKPGARRPTGYRLHTESGLAKLFVPGFYDRLDHSIGGADQLRDVEELYELIWEAFDAGYSVLYESKGRGDGVSRLSTMFHPGLAQVVVIDHPISECVKTVRDRGGRLLVETARRHDAKIRKQSDEIASRGYEVSYLRRKEAAEKVKSLLAT